MNGTTKKTWTPDEIVRNAQVTASSSYDAEGYDVMILIEPPIGERFPAGFGQRVQAAIERLSRSGEVK